MPTKMEILERTMGANADESMGATRLRKGAGLAAVAPAKAPAKPGRYQGLGTAKDAAVIPIDRIEPDPDQPRKEFEPLAINRLANSLKARGQLQPIRVRWSEQLGRYVIICGQRRWMAARIAGLDCLTCIINDRPDDPTSLLIDQMVENCVREDLPPIDQATAMKALIELKGWSQLQLADQIGITQSAVSKALALLDLPTILREKVIEGDLSPSVARELGRVDDPERLGELVHRAVSERWGQSQASEAARRPDISVEEPASKYSGGIIQAPVPAPEIAPKYSGGIIPGDSQAVPKALPNWRDCPAMGCEWLSSELIALLADSEIETLGEAWGLLENGWLVEGLAWKPSEAKLLEVVMVKLREAEGDPDPFLRHLPKPILAAPGEGRDVPKTSSRTATPASEIGATRHAPSWKKSAYCDTDEVVLARLGCLEVVVRSTLGERPLKEQLDALRDAIAKVESLLI